MKNLNLDLDKFEIDAEDLPQLQVTTGKLKYCQLCKSFWRFNKDNMVCECRSNVFSVDVEVVNKK